MEFYLKKAAVFSKGGVSFGLKEVKSEGVNVDWYLNQTIISLFTYEFAWLGMGTGCKSGVMI